MPTLFDTSVWIRHFRSPEKHLIEALEEGSLLIHEAIVGELIVGNIPNPKSTIKDLLRLSFAPIIPFKELLSFIESWKLTGRGLSWIDIHLLASALATDAELVTYDLPLSAAWKRIKK
jgi:hypothetical protein